MYLHFHLGVIPESPGYPPASTTPEVEVASSAPFTKVTQGPSGNPSWETRRRLRNYGSPPQGGPRVEGFFPVATGFRSRVPGEQFFTKIRELGLKLGWLSFRRR